MPLSLPPNRLIYSSANLNSNNSCVQICYHEVNHSTGMLNTYVRWNGTLGGSTTPNSDNIIYVLVVQR